MHVRVVCFTFLVLAGLLIFQALPPRLPRGYTLEHLPRGVITRMKDGLPVTVVDGDVQWAASAPCAIYGYTRAHTGPEAIHTPAGYFALLTLSEETCLYGLTKKEMNTLLALPRTKWPQSREAVTTALSRSPAPAPAPSP